MDPETTRLIGKTAFDLANDVAKQLITLSTAVLALSITFTKDVLKDAAHGPQLVLRLCWLLYLLSICFGVWTMLALTGTLMPVDPVAQPPSLSFGGNVRLPAALQVVAFVMATVFIIMYGWRSVRTQRQPNGHNKDGDCSDRSNR